MCITSLPQLSHQLFSSLVGLIAGALFPCRLGAVSGTINPCVLPIGPGGDWWFGLTWLFLLIDRAPALLLPVHPHLVSRADDLATVDVDALAVVDVVADLHVGLADYALAHAGLVSGDVVHETFVMQVQGFALQEERIGVLTA